MQIKLYNFLTRKKEVFKPIRKDWVGLYTCGPTVYNYAHIGNLRTYIFEDVLRRALELAGYKVKHVMNITDVDDKIIAGAKKSGKNIGDFSQPYKKAFFEDLDKLNIKKAWKYPEATKHIPEMVGLAKRLLQKKIAYLTKDGVYFDISKIKFYGRLANPKQNERKDFVIWKLAKKNEPFWKSPFGHGRPGWHLECSAMSMKYLGSTFDLHAGGVDLLFPHHENEIAQSEGATGKKFAKYFIEGEHLLVDGTKMSKSFGNVFTLKDIERRGLFPVAFRYFVLGAHYHSKLNFTWNALEGAATALDRICELVRALKKKNVGTLNFHPQVSAFQKAIFDDLDTPKALAVMWKLIKSYNKSPKKYYPKDVLDALYAFDKVLGLGLKHLKAEIPSESVLKLLKERGKARKAGNFKKADEIREAIRRLGWQINDAPDDSQLFHL